ncbi:MAG TPA: LPS export ABC transporter periplasmic protein LptC [Syntrophorhabdaceae bacterium]|nr:LPS export ABC transporter periplasmic protein LptC [Syntrophorhabdaceae bacterium]HQM82015.1 LPS export ABC transporter periplasmic protein LptC [Syntrophorhabdaceae bacterium]
MKNRKIVIYIAAGFIASSLLLAFYFFLKKPERIGSPILDEEKRAILFKDVRYFGEREGVVDWEITAKTARKFLDRPEVQLELLEGRYKPKAGITVAFKGMKGTMDIDKQKGVIEDVDILYRNEYTLKSPSMSFDFKNNITSTKSPVNVKGKKLTLTGIGLVANMKDETVRVERDVRGYIDTEKAKFHFQSDAFFYNLKDSTYILDGKVVLKGQDMNMLCDKLYIFSRNEEPERIDAKGKVRLISKGTIAKSEKAVYYFNEDKVVFTESPRIFKDNVEMVGESVIYSISNGKFSIQKPRMRMER